MDLHSYKWPQPEVVDGFPVHPLPQPTFEQLLRQSSAWAVRTDAASWAAHLQVCCEVVARSTGITPEEARSLSVPQIVALVQAWARVQRRSLPNASRLEPILRLKVVDDPFTQAEGAFAYHAPTAAEFYDRPLTELTTGQLLYYWTLRNCFREMHVEPDGKRYSRKWLEQKAQEAQQE